MDDVFAASACTVSLPICGTKWPIPVPTLPCTIHSSNCQYLWISGFSAARGSELGESTQGRRLRHRNRARRSPWRSRPASAPRSSGSELWSSEPDLFRPAVFSAVRSSAVSSAGDMPSSSSSPITSMVWAATVGASSARRWMLTEGGVDQRLGGGRVDLDATVVVPLAHAGHEPDDRRAVLTGPESTVDGEQEDRVQQLAEVPPAGVVEAAQSAVVVAYPAGGQVTDRRRVRAGVTRSMSV